MITTIPDLKTALPGPKATAIINRALAIAALDLPEA